MVLHVNDFVDLHSYNLEFLEVYSTDLITSIIKKLILVQVGL